MEVRGGTLNGACDVIVIGGGPAGAMTAYHLAKAGVRVTVLEAKAFPRQKPCGGGLQWRAVSSIPFDLTPVLRGTIRAFRKETMALVKERIETISTGIAKTMGGTAKADVRVVFPPLVNDPNAVKFIADVAAEIVGPENMNREGPYVMASEDFSYMLEQVPGAFINIGNGGGEGGCEVHNPGYDFNDEALTLGSTLWARVVERRLAKDAR